MGARHQKRFYDNRVILFGFLFICIKMIIYKNDNKIFLGTLNMSPTPIKLSAQEGIYNIGMTSITIMMKNFLNSTLQKKWAALKISSK